MRYFPTFFDLSGKPVLVIGGGPAAIAKTRLLRDAGAVVTVIVPPGTARTPAWDGLDVAWRARRFEARDVDGCALVVAGGGGDADLAAVRAARRAGIPINVVDRPALSTFITPAIVDRDDVVVAISTGGTAPGLARLLRARIESILPPRLGALAAFTDAFRNSVKALIPDGRRRAFWDQVLRGPIGNHVLAGRETRAREQMIAALNSPDRKPQGRVSLVGAGPGAADLLTLRAVQSLQDADVVIYDRLVGDGVLDYARRDAERIYVGKASGRHNVPQAEINRLLVRHALQGRHVVRLKGGDPFIFGRGGEELAHLKAHGIAVAVVPGITAATACADATGIPLTVRGVAEAVTFVTGHRAPGQPELDWAALARADQTLVIYMGIANAGPIAARLIGNGLNASTPVAVVENGSLPTQRVTTGRLDELAGLIDQNDIRPPAVIIIGRVVDAVAGGASSADDLPALAVAGG